MPKQSTSVRTTRKAKPTTSRRASTTTTTRSKSTPKRGFAAMSLQKRREIARKGVRARRAG